MGTFAASAVPAKFAQYPWSPRRQIYIVSSFEIPNELIATLNEILSAVYSWGSLIKDTINSALVARIPIY